MKINIKKNILWISILYLSLYIPLTITIYSQSWYEFNYKIHDTYKNIEKDKALNATKNLISFFLHKEELNNHWNEKERLHMKDVRNIYDILFILGILSFLGLGIENPKTKDLKKISMKNITIITIFIIIIPFFSYFWNNIFHNILFSNNYWIINQNDISYYIFPIEFFIYSTIFLILTSIIINISLIIIIKNQKKIKN